MHSAGPAFYEKDSWSKRMRFNFLKRGPKKNHQKKWTQRTTGTVAPADGGTKNKNTDPD